MTVVITPVGTSLFTNGGKENTTISDSFEVIEDQPESQWDSYKSYLGILKDECADFIAKAKGIGQFGSAELQSTAKIQNELQAEIIVQFLASDTIASRLAAEILRDQINDPNFILGGQIEAKFNSDPTVGKVDVIPNLQVNNRTDFSRDGMPNLFHKINYIKDWEAGGNQNLAINITAGYGATLPYLTIFGQLEHVPLYYNFEASNELIVIPQAPLAIDWDLIKRHARVLAQIDKGIDASNWQNFKDTNHRVVEELDAFIWWDISAGACLSPIGVIFWEQYLKSHFVVELAQGINTFSNYEINEAIKELYERLNTALHPGYLDPSRCYGRIRSPKLGGPSGDLNHTGQVSGQDIFIFKSTKHDQMRLMYTFKVNGRTITRLKIFDIRGHQTTLNYDKWKGQFRTIPAIDFDTHIFDIP